MLSIVENTTCFLSLAIGLPLMFQLLVDAARVRWRHPPAVSHHAPIVQISCSMGVYLATNVVLGVPSMPSFVYAVAAQIWSTELPSGSYWLGIWAGAYYAVGPIAMLFLTLERCAVLHFALNPNLWHRVQRSLFWLSLVTISTVYALFHLLNARANLLALPQAGSCGLAAACNLRSKGQIALTIKSVVETANLMAILYFFHLLRGQMHSKSVVSGTCEI